MSTLGTAWGHGPLTVLTSPPPPPASACVNIDIDSFNNRTLSSQSPPTSGWGIASSGKYWSLDAVTGDGNDITQEISSGILKITFEGDSGGGNPQQLGYGNTIYDTSLPKRIRLKFRVNEGTSQATSFVQNAQTWYPERKVVFGSNGFGVDLLVGASDPIAQIIMTGLPETVFLEIPDILANTWYWLEAMEDADGCRARVYQDGSFRNTWDIQRPATPTAGSRWTNLVVGAVAGNVQDGDTFIVEIDQVESLTGDSNCVSLNGCSAVVFDTFNRTVSNSWGVSTTGYTWVKTNQFAPDDRLAVNGTSGLIIHPSGVVTQNTPTPAITDSSTAAPWYNAFTVTLKVTFTNLANLLRFQIFFTESSASGAQARTVILDFENNELEIINTRVTQTVVSYSSWTSGQAMFIKLSCALVTGTSRVKVWNEGEAEPDWLASVAASSADQPAETFSLNIDPVAFSASTTAIDFIDFDYDGKPCF